jgi:hypothetical protein
MNSAEHREEGLSGDACPKRLCEREMERVEQMGEGIYRRRESGEAHACAPFPIGRALNLVGQTPRQRLLSLVVILIYFKINLSY